MPPLLQCLKPTVAARQLSLFSRAAFTTSARTLADFPSLNSHPSRGGAPSRAPHSRAAPSPGNDSSTSRILSIIDKSSRRHKDHRFARPAPSARATAEDLARHKQALDLTKQIARRWQRGDVYAPHDLSEVEMQKWRRRGKPAVDVVDVLELDPIVEYRNFSILSEYMTPMGRIKHSRETGLRNVNQRRMAKAIRRGVGMGFMPSVHRHPEILMKESTRRNEQMSRVGKMI